MNDLMPRVPLFAVTALLIAGCAPQEDTDTADPLVVDTEDTGVEDTDAGDQKDVPDPDGVELPDSKSYDYAVSHVFSMTDVQGGFDGSTAVEDPTILCTEGCESLVEQYGAFTLYPIDSEFGFYVQDFVGHEPKVRDYDYAEGWIGDVSGEDGTHWGVAISDAETDAYKAGYPLGAWCAGLGEDLVKCSSEHYVSMEHVLTCYETVPYMLFDPVTGEASESIYEYCEPLEDELDRDITTMDAYEGDLSTIARGTDYGVTLKDDGKLLYRWGTWDKKPNDIRLYAQMPLPEEWAADPYRITRAELVVVHTITNNPNDQIRPEDLENEGATGRLPGYTIDDDGNWLSDRDCYESDGDFIPAGTVLRNAAWANVEAATVDLQQGLTNAWYTTMDRDPFEEDPASGIGPRWRLKAPKFGQDIPGVEIPIDDCTEPPLQKGEEKYERGELTTTTINLLDWADGDSPLAVSTGWQEPTEQIVDENGLTINGVQLSDQFDLAVYIKGDQKEVLLYSAHLYLDYEPL